MAGLGEKRSSSPTSDSPNRLPLCEPRKEGEDVATCRQYSDSVGQLINCIDCMRSDYVNGDVLIPCIYYQMSILTSRLISTNALINGSWSYSETISVWLSVERVSKKSCRILCAGLQGRIWQFFSLNCAMSYTTLYLYQFPATFLNFTFGPVRIPNS